MHQLSYPGTWYLNAGDMVTRQPRGAHPAIAPSQLMEAGDGWIMFCCQTQKFWERVAERLGHPEWVKDPRFVKVEHRRANRAILQETMEAVLKTNTVSHWMEKFGGYVPAAPVFDIEQAMENPYVAEIDMIYEELHAGFENGKIRLLSSPYKFNGKRLKGGIAPELGADTKDLLG